MPFLIGLAQGPVMPLAVVIGERAVPTGARLRSHPGGLLETRSRDLLAVVSGLFDRGIRRVFVEGGPTLASALVAADLVDEFAIYLAPALLGGGGLAIGDIGVPSMAGIKRLELLGVQRLGNDLLVTAVPAAAAVTSQPRPAEKE